MMGHLKPSALLKPSAGAIFPNGKQVKAFDPKSLFAKGERGVIVDLKLANMFQDVAGAIPAIVGNTVARINDTSGNNNHALQPDTTKQPRLQIDSEGKYYLQADGVDDFLQSQNTINMTATNTISTVCKIRMTSNTQLGYAFTFGDFALTGVTGTLHLRAPQATNTLVIGFASKGTTTASSTATLPSLTTNAVVSAISSTNNMINLRVNGATSQSTGNQGGGNYGNHSLYLGRRSGQFDAFAGRIYSFMMISRQLTEVERTAMESYFK